MTIRTIARAGLALGLLSALAACAPAYYPAYPTYYGHPAYAPPAVRPPSQPVNRAQPIPQEPQSAGGWVNPEPAH